MFFFLSSSISLEIAFSISLMGYSTNYYLEFDFTNLFHNGEIVEDGSHGQLINKKGYYYRMYQAQAQWYN
jgi:hypothetical protein